MCWAKSPTIVQIKEATHISETNKIQKITNIKLKQIPIGIVKFIGTPRISLRLGEYFNLIPLCIVSIQIDGFKFSLIKVTKNRATILLFLLNTGIKNSLL